MILSNCQAQGPGQSSGQDQVIQNQSPITGHGSDKKIHCATITNKIWNQLNSKVFWEIELESKVRLNCIYSVPLVHVHPYDDEEDEDLGISSE